MKPIKPNRPLHTSPLDPVPVGKKVRDWNFNEIGHLETEYFPFQPGPARIQTSSGSKDVNLTGAEDGKYSFGDY